MNADATSSLADTKGGATSTSALNAVSKFFLPSKRKTPVWRARLKRPCPSLPTLGHFPPVLSKSG